MEAVLDDIKNQELIRELLKRYVPEEALKNDDIMERTPARYENLMLEATKGYKGDIDSLFARTFEVKDHDRKIVVISQIPFYSLCEHHLAPFFGHVHVGFLPKKKTIGLSKIPRLVEVFSKRIQIQERMTEQIVDTIQDKLEPSGVMVITTARHLCMEMRGVKKPGALTTVSAIRGCFEFATIRTEFLKLVEIGG